MNKKFLAMAALALITTGAQAKVKLPHILGDNMIYSKTQRLASGDGTNQEPP